MKVFLLALNVLAALLATVATILFITNRGEKLRVYADLSRSEAQVASLQSERNSLKTTVGKLTGELQTLKTNNSRLQTDIATLQTQQNETSSALGQSRNMLIVKDQVISALNGEIVDVKRRLGDAQVRLQQIPALNSQIDALQQSIALAKNPIAPDGGPVPKSAAGSYSVLAVGPEDSFVVVNYGAPQGARPNQRLLIRRGTDLIGVALISDVRDELSIGQVDPHALRAALHKGDSIVLAQ